ncbi:MAG: BatD family protein [Candidatus Omnitrophica bacterium]|nr:BatD family protein [Candidatus Omnitrophota bacterium]
MKKVFIAIILIVSPMFCAFAQDVNFTASIEKNRISVGNPVYLYLTLDGAQESSRPEVSAKEGLQIKYVGPSTKISVVNGRVSQSVTYTYLIIPLTEGEFQLGPFSLMSKNIEYQAPPILLSVYGQPQGVPSSANSSGVSGAMSSASQTQAGQPQESYGDERVFLVISIGKRLLYINEEVPLTIKLYSATSLRDIEYPAFPHEGFSAGEFEEPERRRENVNGIRYDVLIFKQNLFGIKEGNYLLGPARLKCKMLVNRQSSQRASVSGRSIFDDDFFASRFGYQAYPIEVSAQEVPVTILPFPKEGKPSDFQGAVGDFNFSADTNSTKVKVGDPVIISMAVTGAGNLDTVTAPSIVSSEEFKTYEPQVMIKGDKKVYEQVLIPKSSDIKEIPPVSFSFFNPQKQKYETIKKGPFPLNVTEQPEAEGGMKIVSMPLDGSTFYPKETIGQDILHIKDNIGQVYPGNRVLFYDWKFWGTQFFLTLFFVGFCFRQKRKEKMLHDEKYARFLKAPRKARKGLIQAKLCLEKKNLTLFYDLIFKILQEYFAGRFNLPKGNITVQIIEDKVSSLIRNEDMFNLLRDVFSKCEMARYASSSLAEEEAYQMFDSVKRIIDYMEKVKL